LGILFDTFLNFFVAVSDVFCFFFFFFLSFVVFGVVVTFCCCGRVGYISVCYLFLILYIFLVYLCYVPPPTLLLVFFFFLFFEIEIPNCVLIL